MPSILALDVGEVRIGVALADLAAPFPHPLTTLVAAESLVDEFAKLLKQHHVRTVVVGMPRNQSGERTAQSERVEYIVDLLNVPSDVTVVWQDESLTSVKAEEELKKRKKPHTKGDIDALAATYILEDFLRTNPGGTVAAPEAVAPLQAPGTAKPDKSAKKKKQTKSKKRRLLRTLLLAVVTLVVGMVVAAFVWYTHALTPLTKDDQFTVISVKSGSSTKQIAEDLESQRVIRSATAFTIYARLHKTTNLQAGDYRLSSKQSVPSIAETLAGGKVTSVNVLIAPGLRLDQIIDKLEAAGYSKSDVSDALLAVRDHPVLKGLPEGTKLEGYLFPDTYQIGPDTSAETLLRLMLDNFQKQLTPEINQGIASQGLTLNQAVILASIVQKEVPEPDVQRTVAQVFISRLNQGIVLGSDVTYMYGAVITGEIASPSLNSPYNTRKVAGLPPTAISNFNLSALQAVANPTATDYLYFVAGDDGTTYFSRTLEEHEALVQKYCTKLCG